MLQYVTVITYLFSSWKNIVHPTQKYFKWYVVRYSSDFFFDNTWDD